jgi:demethylmenaquinone methyltransferase/2-methoxy-6-polyprenyl-1,4-benzoquinol methylase
MTQRPLRTEIGRWSRPDDRQRAVNVLFNRAARHYDHACSLMSFGFGQRYRREALARAGVEPGMRVLDVGTGTGLLCREISRTVGPSGRPIGLDPSANMMTAGDLASTVTLVQSIGERLPFGDSVFDFVTMGYALRHLEDLDAAFEEFRRVLKPRGRVLVLEITQPSSAVGRLVARAYFGTVVPLITRLGTGSQDAAELMRFYWETIAACVPPTVVMGSLARAGFDEVRRDVEIGVFSAYTARRVS